MVGEADDCAGGIVLIYEVTLRLIHSRCASLANQSAISIAEIRGAESFQKSRVFYHSALLPVRGATFLSKAFYHDLQVENGHSVR